MSAIVRIKQGRKWFSKRNASGRVQEKLRSGFCPQAGDAPDRLVFVVSLIILPLVLFM